MRPITCDPGGMTPKKTTAQQAEATLRALQVEREKLHALQADLAARELAAVAMARGAQPRPVSWREIARWMGRSGSNVCTQFKPLLAVTVTVAQPDEPPPTRPTRR